MAGLAIGILASAASARLIASLLFATSPWDASAYGVMMVLLLAGAVVSGYIPARRASCIDPMMALRNQ
jgi:ABC-type antimicrobial peptide transport system permease subunit